MKRKTTIGSEKMRKKVNIFEERIEKEKKEKEELEARQRLYEQNRLIWREKMRKLKKFIYENKVGSKSNESFFEENKKYFEQFNVKNYDELKRLLNSFDRENPEEAEKFEKDRYTKYLKIDHIKDNEFTILPEIRRFDYSNINLKSGISKICILNAKKYFTQLHNCNVNEFAYIPNKAEYIKNKINNYEIYSLNNYIIQGIKKIKYNNEAELIESSNISNITFEKIKNNLICSAENYCENGIPIDELRINKIQKFVKNFNERDKQNYEKVKKIINGYNNNIEDKSNNLNDHYCLNCNQCFNGRNSIKHNRHSILKIEKNLGIDNDLNNIDYNANLNKIYNILKRDQNKILKNGNHNLIVYYGKLLYFLYAIIINNNSIEELNSTIIDINDDYMKEKESETFNNFFYDYFSFYIRKISKLTYFKIKKIEQILADLEEHNKNINIETDVIDDEEEIINTDKIERMIRVLRYSNGNLDEILSPSQSGNLDNIAFNFPKISEEEKKKYFLKLGLRLKFNYGKKESITELYSKAKELNLQPFDYEAFLMQQLSILKTRKKHK
jgi:hypothetical protein